jgi:isopentenyldiphosphate isomerase
METQAIIVDKDNNVIGHKNRSELTSDDIYRVSAARITDEDGNILLGQRALTKKKNP